MRAAARFRRVLTRLMAVPRHNGSEDPVQRVPSGVEARRSRRQPGRAASERLPHKTRSALAGRRRIASHRLVQVPFGRLAILAILVAGTVFLAGPLFEPSKSIDSMDSGSITLVTQTSEVTPSAVFAGLSAQVTAADYGVDGILGVPPSNTFWIVLEQATTERYANFRSECATGNDEGEGDGRDVTAGDLPTWITPPRAWTDKSTHILEFSSTSTSEGDDVVDCIVGLWESGGATTRILRTPSLNYIVKLRPTAGPPPQDPAVCAAPIATETIQLPVGASILASKADPDFAMTGRTAERKVSCDTVGLWNADGYFVPAASGDDPTLHTYVDYTNDPPRTGAGVIFAGWPGALLSVTDQQAQAALVTRGLLAGAGLGVTLQLALDTVLAMRRLRVPRRIVRIMTLARSRILSGVALTLLGLATLHSSAPVFTPTFVGDIDSGVGSTVLRAAPKAAGTAAVGALMMLLGTVGIVLVRSRRVWLVAVSATALASLGGAAIYIATDQDYMSAAILGLLTPVILKELLIPSRWPAFRLALGTTAFGATVIFAERYFELFDIISWTLALLASVGYTISGIPPRVVPERTTDRCAAGSLAAIGLAMASSGIEPTLGLAVVFVATVVAATRRRQLVDR